MNIKSILHVFYSGLLSFGLISNACSATPDPKLAFFKPPIGTYDVASGGYTTVSNGELQEFDIASGAVSTRIDLGGLNSIGSFSSIIAAAYDASGNFYYLYKSESSSFTFNLMKLSPGSSTPELVTEIVSQYFQGESALAYDPGYSCDPTDDTDMDGNPDNDGDGLCDAWEKNGIDVNADGNYDLILNTSINHKDLFIEVDHMDCAVAQSLCSGITHNHKLEPEAWQILIDSFNDAPVQNPDGINGVTLHLMEDEAIPEYTPINFYSRSPGPANDYLDIKEGSNDLINPGVQCGTRIIDGHFGTVKNRTSPNCEHILSARSLVYRYALLAHDELDNSIQGIAEPWGNDLMITQRQPYFYDLAGRVATIWGTSQRGEWVDLQASTLMHEIGHTLGLYHGGSVIDKDVNCKPNYISVMNYAYQGNYSGEVVLSLTGLPPRDRTNRRIDFSGSDNVITLNETNLDEGVGIGGPIGKRIIFGHLGIKYVGPSNGAVDWNTNGTPFDTGVSSDTNNPPTFTICGNPNTLDVSLKGYDDWKNIKFGFRNSPYFSKSVFLQEDQNEITGLDYLVGSLGGTVGDVDGDSIQDAQDSCIDMPNMGQRDTDTDGYGNYCDPDFDNDQVVNAADLAYFKTNFFSSDPDADLNGDGIVNAADLAIFKRMFFKAPGPSGLVP